MSETRRIRVPVGGSVTITEPGIYQPVWYLPQGAGHPTIPDGWEQDAGRYFSLHAGDTLTAPLEFAVLD